MEVWLLGAPTPQAKLSPRTVTSSRHLQAILTVNPLFVPWHRREIHFEPVMMNLANESNKNPRLGLVSDTFG